MPFASLLELKSLCETYRLSGTLINWLLLLNTVRVEMEEYSWGQMMMRGVVGRSGGVADELDLRK